VPRGLQIARLCGLALIAGGVALPLL